MTELDVDLPAAGRDIGLAAAGFGATGIAEASTAAQADRVDYRYVATVADAVALVGTLTGHYRALDVGGSRLREYRTTYFDTPAFGFYTAHHNGVLPRLKVRLRSYADSGESFLEVKQKTGGRRTVKSRVPFTESDALPAGREVPGLHLPLPAELHESLRTTFHRLTLVRADAHERVTIDVGVRFSVNGETAAFPSLAVIEVKQDQRAPSPVIEHLRSIHGTRAMISKYCVGMAALRPTLRQNRFRAALARLAPYRTISAAT